MSTDAIPLRVYHIPQSRSSSVMRLLEELDVAYEIKLLDIKANDQLRPEYLAINPMGKVPAIRHGDALITEQVAIGIYLADLFPEAGITPGVGDALRGPYLRWYVFYAACFEPALIDKALKREAGHVAMSPYGDLGMTVKTLVDQLEKGPWLLGEKFTAPDVLWGSALTWMTGFGLLDAVPPIKAYIDRWNARPSVKKVAEIDAELLKAQGN